MAEKTRSMVVETPGKMAMWEFALPQIGDEDALLRLEMAGVCGSDPGCSRQSHRAGRQVSADPGARGSSGGSRDRGQSRGEAEAEGRDRVIVETAFGCGHCPPCLAGNYVHCEAQMFYGHTIPCGEPPHLWGAYGQHLYIAPRAMVHKIGGSLPPEEAVFICAVLGNAVRWLRMLGGVSIGHTVVIEGPVSRDWQG